MRKSILTFMIIILGIVFVNAQNPAKMDTASYTEALIKHDLFTKKQAVIQKEYATLLESFAKSDSIIQAEFDKTKVFYWFIDMEKLDGAESVDKSSDTIVVRAAYREKEPVLKSVEFTQEHFNQWILNEKVKFKIINTIIK